METRTTQRAHSFSIPPKNEHLAECFGILMGDGGMSKYQVTISLHHTDDKEYGVFVVQLLFSLFGVLPRVYHRASESVNNITISRTLLVRHLHALGLPIGDKIRANIDMPDWVKEDMKFRVACLRGLVDSDGCVFTHRYKSKGRKYEYKKLSFTSKSRLLLHSVYETLHMLGIRARLGSNFDVRLDSVADMERYFLTVGSHNPKHLRRYDY